MKGRRGEGLGEGERERDFTTNLFFFSQLLKIFFFLNFLKIYLFLNQKTGISPLFVAAENGYEQIVDILLEKGEPNVDLPDQVLLLILFFFFHFLIFLFFF